MLQTFSQNHSTPIQPAFHQTSQNPSAPNYQTPPVLRGWQILKNHSVILAGPGRVGSLDLPGENRLGGAIKPPAGGGGATRFPMKFSAI